MKHSTEDVLVKPMRIAHVSATFPPYKGGTGNVCYYNARELVRLGHEVHVFTAQYEGAPNEEFLDGVKVHRLRPLVQVGNAAFLPQLLWRMGEFDVIHLHYPFFGGEIAAIAALVTHIPLVITYHQDVHLSGWRGIIERLMRFSVGWLTLRSASRVLFTSFDYAHHSYILPFLQGRESIIGELPNGVDTTVFSPGLPSPELLFRHQLSPNDRVALVVAGLDKAHYFKGINVFLEALTHLPEHVKGIIVGDGDLRNTYEVYAERLGIASRTFFTGRVSTNDLTEYYRLAHVTVLPSVTMGEAFGLVLLESMACGTPVIATKLPGVRTLIEEEEQGLLVEPSNSRALKLGIQLILHDENKRKNMAALGRKEVLRLYSWTKIGEDLDHIYQEVLRGRNLIFSPFL